MPFFRRSNAPTEATTQQTPASPPQTPLDPATQRRQWEERLAQADQELATDPGAYDAWLKRSQALFNLERYTEATEAREQLIALHPYDAQHWTSLADILMRVPD